MTQPGGRHIRRAAPEADGLHVVRIAVTATGRVRAVGIHVELVAQGQLYARPAAGQLLAPAQ
ncbi:hypothetical protein GCM10017771_00500 [Streptomyces capitiformicae]|uniref:Uncharacterized protein n=1 Tax=Streptomyces capitiformicae TaxID=2014920 RepID=A0A919L262_9ACTN|nr:hypothetical protein GCM10017771_00500 [Streptomyces capitiformicae]